MVIGQQFKSLIFVNFIIQSIYMENQGMFYKTTTSSTPQTRFYRSYKYKSILESTNAINNTTSLLIPNQTFTCKITSNNKDIMKSSYRKAKSYSTNKQQTNRQKYVKDNQEDFAAVQLKPAYLQSYDRLLSSNQKNSKQKLAAKIGRVHLPCIIDFDPSNFTALDPLFLPIEHIQRGIKDLSQQLPAPKIQMSQIHHDMVLFQQKILKQIKQTQSYGLKEIDRLKKLLRNDMVTNQQNNMRFKRQCIELKVIDQQFKLNFENTKPRIDVLQVQIFSNQPFQLTRNSKLDEQFPQQYF